MSEHEVLERINQIIRDNSLSADAMVSEIGELLSNECDFGED